MESAKSSASPFAEYTAPSELQMGGKSSSRRPVKSPSSDEGVVDFKKLKVRILSISIYVK